MAQLGRRLPPIAGLLDDSLDQAIRARQRRVLIADNPSQKLSALRVCDSAIDQALISASLYGADASLQLDARIASSSGTAREAAVFLRVALAVHTHDPALMNLVRDHLGNYPRAILEAYWFFPAPIGPFDDSVEHILALFEESKNTPTLQTLAMELIGRRDVKKLRQQLRLMPQESDLAPQVHLAMARLGDADELTKQFVSTSLLADAQKQNKIHTQAAINIAAVDPRLLDKAMLDQVLSAPYEESVAPVWAIAACWDPQGLYRYAITRSDLPPALMLRIVALTGYISGIIVACADMANTPGAITAQQADVLILSLGNVPTEARCEPNDQEQKSKALRALLLRVCRAAHIPLNNDADRCAWDVNAILGQADQSDNLRLRAGTILRDTVPKFGSAVFEITHALRQWLFIERASTAGITFSLSALDVARRQKLALMVAEFADELNAD